MFFSLVCRWPSSCSCSATLVTRTTSYYYLIFNDCVGGFSMAWISCPPFNKPVSQIPHRFGYSKLYANSPGIMFKFLMNFTILLRNIFWFHMLAIWMRNGGRYNFNAILCGALNVGWDVCSQRGGYVVSNQTNSGGCIPVPGFLRLFHYSTSSSGTPPPPRSLVLPGRPLHRDASSWRQ